MSECVDETGHSLAKTKRVCQLMGHAMKIAFIVFCIFWLFVGISTFYSMAIIGSSSEPISSLIFTVVMYLARGAVVVVIFIMLIGMFSDVAKNETPFTIRQANRLGVMAASLFGYALLELAYSVNSFLLQIGAMGTGVVATGAGDNAILAINFAPFIAAAVVFAFSSVFKYGVLLQEFSDEVM